ncbi:unnamed protein product [Leptosia nina]|uniref:Uncharacterized protein n=1 Tax=Leptosia nina TaxID=320188 RepID=A0AAV1K323_9NEOP
MGSAGALGRPSAAAVHWETATAARSQRSPPFISYVRQLLIYTFIVATSATERARHSLTSSPRKASSYLYGI